MPWASHAPRSIGIERSQPNEYTVHPLSMALSRLEARAQILSGRATTGSLRNLDRHEGMGENRIAPWWHKGNPLHNLRGGRFVLSGCNSETGEKRIYIARRQSMTNRKITEDFERIEGSIYSPRIGLSMRVVCGLSSCAKEGHTSYSIPPSKTTPRRKIFP
ncbi:MAG: hypothetical protein CLLPBCKN_006446 [Chroococcidiopsis cubana SAG 39.79]|nr:hypothetical protein [Chroococcidiopsis cubana SAG 39.79]